MLQEWRRLFSRGVHKATLTKHGARNLRLHWDLHNEGQKLDAHAWFWMKTLSSLARSFTNISDLDLQDLPLVSVQSVRPGDFHKNITLRALTLALPQMPALHTLRLFHNPICSRRMRVCYWKRCSWHLTAVLPSAFISI